MDLNIDLISFGRGKTSVFFSSLSALVRLYQCVQHRCQYLSKFISTYSKIISLCQSFSALSELISNCLSLSVRTVQSGSLCQTFSVMAVQYQYLSKFVSEKGESQYFSDPIVLVHKNIDNYRRLALLSFQNILILIIVIDIVNYVPAMQVRIFGFVSLYI